MKHVACATMRRLSNANLHEWENEFSHFCELVLLKFGNRRFPIWLPIAKRSFILLTSLNLLPLALCVSELPHARLLAALTLLKLLSLGITQASLVLLSLTRNFVLLS